MSIVRTAYAFSPTSISNCALWLDGADPAGTGVVPASGTLATWVDKSRSGNNAIAYTGATAPSYSSTTSNVTFGTNYYYISGISSAPANETLFMVLRRTSTTWNTPYGTSISGGATWYMDNTNPSFIAWNPFGNPNSSGANLLFYNNVTNVVCGTNSGGTNVMYLNGTGDTAGSTSFTSGGIMTIGTSSSGVNGAPSQNGFVGTISEVIFYSFVLGTTQRQQVEAYLAQKWGATSSLVPGHPGLTTRVYRSDYLVPNSVKPTPYYTQFSPRQISGLVVWLDGTDPAGNGVIPANGATVSTWTDKSGNGNNGTAVNTPTYTLSSKGIATSSGAYFTLPNGAFPFNDSSYTYFFVFTTTTTGSVNSLFGGGVPGTTRSTVAVRLGTNGANNVIQTYWWANGINDLLVSNTYTANVISIAETWYATGSSRTITLNFAGSSTDSPAVPGARLQANTNNYLGLAYPGDGALTGFHYEFIVYNTSLSTAQRQQVESYLAQKWGLTASIPVGHSHLTQQAGAVTTVALSKYRMVGLARVTGRTFTFTGYTNSPGAPISYINSSSVTNGATTFSGSAGASETNVFYSYTNDIAAPVEKGVTKNSSRDTINLPANTTGTQTTFLSYGPYDKSYTLAGSMPTGFSTSAHTVIMIMYHLGTTGAIGGGGGEGQGNIVASGGILYQMGRSSVAGNFATAGEVIVGENGAWDYNAGYSMSINSTTVNIQSKVGWVMVAFVWNAGTTCSYYYNGSTSMSSGGGNGASSMAGTIYIGVDQRVTYYGGIPGNNLNAEVAFYGLWNSALTSTQIGAFYTQHAAQFSGGFV